MNASKCSINLSCYYFLNLIKQDIFQHFPKPVVSIGINLLLPSPRSKIRERGPTELIPSWGHRAPDTMHLCAQLFLFSKMWKGTRTHMTIQANQKWSFMLVSLSWASIMKMPSILFTDCLIHSVLQVSAGDSSSFETSAQLSNFWAHMELGHAKYYLVQVQIHLQLYWLPPTCQSQTVPLQ